MSTRRLPLRHLARVVPLWVVVVAPTLAVTGCSSISNFRPDAGAASNAKTTVAVGDRPLPVSTGEPGSSVVAGTESGTGARLSARSNGRISGHVYDADGSPVANAQVRLAVSGQLGGKDVRAKTDRTGAFTLRDLRPGSAYTVIAEWQGKDAKYNGRAQAKSADTDVKISLVPEGDDEPNSVNHVRGVSERIPVEEKATDEEGVRLPLFDEADKPSKPAPAVNEEDLPPAPEAEAMAPPAENRRRAATSTRKPSASPSWRRGTDGGGQAAPEAQAGPVHSPLDPETRGASATTESPGEPEDEGPNPLPPAIESGPSEPTERASKARPEPDPGPASPPGAEASAAPVPEPFAFDPSVLAELDRPTETRPQAASSTLTEPENLPPPTVDRGASKPGPSPVLTYEEIPDDGRRRPTWGEVAMATRAPSLTPARQRSALAGTASPANPAVGAKAPDKVFCDYDDRHRQLVDFCLPDLEGRPVRFKDIDADLILLDFWGTWCAPCLESIPHLVEMQDKLKGKKLVVVGIACESETAQAAAAKVAATARKLNVNYPVLLSRNDGKAPLEEAFHIQAFPTMLLLDREGRVIYRGEGATASTFGRLERILTESQAEQARHH